MSQSLQISQKQRGSAVALVELLTECADLPTLSWRISDSDFHADRLNGSGPRDADPRPVVAAWAAVLGGEPVETRFMFDGEPNLECALETVWRDVRVRICLSCPVSLLAAEAVLA